jgi:uncharacterized protein YdeI (YjbR/CyaY-like superfamily)
MKPSDVRYFESAQAWHAWLQAHHASSAPVWVAIAKRGCTHHALWHQDALNAALCFGWIDGIVGRLDEEHYALRFSQRRPGSNWSAVNLRRFAELRAARAVHASGQAAFETRDPAASEETPAQLEDSDLETFKTNASAWAFFEHQAPGYRRQASWYVLSARTPATRQRRLTKLIQLSSLGQRLPRY